MNGVSARRRDRGHAVLVMMAVVVVAAVLAVAVARMAATAVARDHAQSAADAAALAGAVGGSAGARRLAIANHAELIEFRVIAARTGTVEVVVRYRDVTATARADRTP